MKLVRLKQYIASFTLVLSIVLSLGVGLPVTAMDAMPMDGMAHESTSAVNCINQHHIAPGAGQKVLTDAVDDKDYDPNPEQLPYFLQFQKLCINEQQTPQKDIVRSSSFRPPDIFKLTSNLQF